MILKGSQRGNAVHLARHLMNARDNEHVELHEVRGFIAEDLHGALQEAEAIAKGTRCQQFLFSLSLNPPQGVDVPVENFEAAIEITEQKLGLDNQPRAIIFHEKEGRRHAHVVWSRIDAEKMTAVNLPFFKTRLMEVARELFLEHGWDIPQGLIDHSLRNPLNFSREEWQQAKRVQVDPRLIKAFFQQCWAGSDSAKALQAALEEKGFFLARGDRRSVVAVDYKGEVYALGRWAGVKAKEVRDRLGDGKDLPSVADTKAKIAARMGQKLQDHLRDVEASHRRLNPSLELKRQQMTERHRSERKTLDQKQEARHVAEINARAVRLPKGLSGLWSRITGKYGRIKRQNEYEAWQSYARDQKERDKLVAKQLDERRFLQAVIAKARERQAREISGLRQEIADYLAMRRDTIPCVQEFNERAASERKRPGRWRERGRDSGPEFDI